MISILYYQEWLESLFPTLFELHVSIFSHKWIPGRNLGRQLFFFLFFLSPRDKILGETTVDEPIGSLMLFAHAGSVLEGAVNRTALRNVQLEIMLVPRSVTAFRLECLMPCT